MLLSRWFDANRGKAMGFAYLGIGVGGAIVPLLAYALTQAYGWHAALKLLGVLMIVVALPPALFIREGPATLTASTAAGQKRPGAALVPLGPVLRQPCVLPAPRRQHVLDRRGRRHDAEPEAVPQPRCRLTQGEVARVLSLVLAGSLAAGC